jgi:ABC-type siderophore export system fused ATPase/permease subunit
MAYDESCAGERLAEYRENQFSVLEGTLQVALTNLWNLIAVVGLVWQCVQMQWAGVKQAARYTIAAMLMGYMGATVRVLILAFPVVQFITKHTPTSIFHRRGARTA